MIPASVVLAALALRKPRASGDDPEDDEPVVYIVA